MTTILIENIKDDFKNKVCSQINLLREGVNRYRVLNPFMFEDGDHLAIILKYEHNRWNLTDEGHTFMHLSYELDIKDLQKGTRREIVENALSNYNIRNHDGELIIFIEDEQFGDSLFSFVQAILKISDVTYLTRERVRSTFYQDFKEFISSKINEERLTFSWHDPEKDPQGNYKVDCRINGMPMPVFLFALQNDDQVRDATITLHQFEKWALAFRTLAIFEDQEEINRRVLARFSDVADKQFSSLSSNKDRIANYLASLV
jgi:hypothetical protein